MCIPGSKPQGYGKSCDCEVAIVITWSEESEAQQDPKSLEDLTGLTELHASTAAMLDGFGEDEEDSISKGAAGLAPHEDDDAWETL